MPLMYPYAYAYESITYAVFLSSEYLGSADSSPVERIIKASNSHLVVFASVTTGERERGRIKQKFNRQVA